MVRNREAQGLINQAVNKGFLEEREQKEAIRKIDTMARVKRSRGLRLLAERDAKWICNEAT